MAVRPTPLGLFGYIVCIIGAMATMGASLATAYWKTTKFRGQPTAHFGLFKICDTQNICHPYSKPPDFVAIVKAAGITAAALYAITLLVLAHLVILSNSKVKSKSHGWLTMMICFFASVFACAGPLYYLAETGMSNWFADHTWDFGYSLYLSFGSGFLGFWAGVCFILAVTRLYREQHPPQPTQPFAYPASAMNVVGPVYIHPSMQQYPGKFPAHPNQGFVQFQPFQNTASAAECQKQQPADKK